MSHHSLSKTVLAIAITAASFNAFAIVGDVTQDVSGSSQYNISGLYQNLTVYGSANRTPGDNGVNLSGANLSGNFTNQATLGANGDSTFGVGLDNTSSITGNLINNSQIALLGAGTVGIKATGAQIGGSLINNASIYMTGQTSAIPHPESVAIKLLDTQLTGGITNSGRLVTTGDGSTGIYATSDVPASAPTHGSIGQDIVNNSIISATGAGSYGIHLENVALGGNVVNSRSAVISANGAGSAAILLDNLQVNAVNNAGNIQATGSQAVGIRIVDSLAPTTSTATNGIINTGSIQSSGIGISVENQTRNPSNVLVIHQNAGFIVGAQKSISGDGQTELQWTAGSITGDMAGMKLVQVSGNGVFNGTQIDAALVDVNTGTLYLANQTTSFTHDLNVAGAGELLLQISDATQPTTPILNVAGNATFASGSKVGITASPEDFTSSHAGTTYTLVKAGSITNGGLTVVSESALLTVSNFTVTGDTINATVNKLSGSDVGTNVLMPQGVSNNALNAIQPFADSVMGQLNPNDQVYKSFANANAAQLAKLSEQLSPTANGGTTHAIVAGQSLINNALTSRSADARGLSSGDVLKDTGVWVKALYSDADQGTRDGIAGFNAYTSGIMIGADGKLNPNLTLGVAYSYLQTDVNSLYDKTKVDANALTAYSSWTHGPMFVDSSVTFGKNSNESKRDVAGTQAKGDYDANVFGINVLAGYDFNIHNGVVVEPRVAARYAHINIDGYTEKDSSAALSVSSQRVEIGELGGGVRTTKNFTVGKGTLKPELTAMYYHDLIGDQGNSTSTFVLGGTPFVTNGASPARDTVELGLGADYSIGAVTVGASYTYTHKAELNADTLQLKAKYAF